MDAVVFASDSVIVKDTVKILSGSILVNRKSKIGDPGVELLIGSKVTSSPGYDLKADRMKIQSGSVIGGNVFYNQLTNSGTINGTKNTPLSLPVGQFPPFARADSLAGTAKAYSLCNGKKDTLRPGIYGDVLLQPSSVLSLVPGIYSFRTLWLKSGAKLQITGNSSVQVRILRGMNLDNGSVLGPASGSGLGASDFIIYVAGIDVQCGYAIAVNINPKSSVGANIYAQTGTILLGQGSIVTGAFFGKVIRVNYGVKLSLASAFNGSIQLTKNNISGESIPEASAVDVPASMELMQNYPNPFNPTTSIKYALPQQSDVSLIIYNVLGQEVIKLVDGVQPQGYHEITWDGRNGKGLTVSSGIYFYRMKAGDFIETRKMILLK
jgi:hypothetical protein